MEITHFEGVLNIEECTVTLESGEVFKISSGSFLLLESGVLKDGQKVSIVNRNSGYDYASNSNMLDYCQLVCPHCGNHW